LTCLDQLKDRSELTEKLKKSRLSDYVDRIQEKDRIDWN
jgi:hypothetical protein